MDRSIVSALFAVAALLISGCVPAGGTATPTDNPTASANAPVFTPAAAQPVGAAAAELRRYERLGQQMYVLDVMAAKATDRLFERNVDFVGEGIRGWVTDRTPSGYVVRFVREGGRQAVYDVDFATIEAPGTVSVPTDPTLTEDQQAQFRAGQLIEPLIDQPCSDTYNLVSFKDPEGDAWLVYALAATTEPGVRIMGGHYRFTVSPDARTVLAHERLSITCYIMGPPDPPEGSSFVAMAVQHLISPTPIETHVFFSLLYGYPFIIVTETGNWGVAEGSIWKLP